MELIRPVASIERSYPVFFLWSTKTSAIQPKVVYTRPFDLGGGYFKKRTQLLHCIIGSLNPSGDEHVLSGSKRRFHLPERQSSSCVRRERYGRYTKAGKPRAHGTSAHAGRDEGYRRPTRHKAMKR
jgi:hypothetical protein